MFLNKKLKGKPEALMCETSDERHHKACFCPKKVMLKVKLYLLQYSHVRGGKPSFKQQ